MRGIIARARAESGAGRNVCCVVACLNIHIEAITCDRKLVALSLSSRADSVFIQMVGILGS